MSKPNDASANITIPGTVSLRAWLAGMAMQGLCAKSGTTLVHGAGQSACLNLVAASLAYADALIAELEKEVTP